MNPNKWESHIHKAIAEGNFVKATFSIDEKKSALFFNP